MNGLEFVDLLLRNFCVELVLLIVLLFFIIMLELMMLSVGFVRIVGSCSSGVLDVNWIVLLLILVMVRLLRRKFGLVFFMFWMCCSENMMFFVLMGELLEKMWFFLRVKVNLVVLLFCFYDVRFGIGVEMLEFLKLMRVL